MYLHYLFFFLRFKVKNYKFKIMIASTINLTIFMIMIIIYFNELKNVSMFIFNFNYIKDLSKIVMEQKCNNIYCEAETDRYKISQNSYNLLQPNDIFNPKTYIILIFIISILIFIYYYNKLFEICEIWKINKWYVSIPVYLLHICLLAILLGIIVMRYAPHDEAGYLNYFKNVSSNNFEVFVGISIFIISACIYNLITVFNYKHLIIALCFMFSITLLLNLLNIVLSFSTNTKPILKTKEFRYSLTRSLNNILNKFKGSTDQNLYKEEYDKLVILKDDLADKTKYPNIMKTHNNTDYIIKILVAFNELIYIKEKYITIDNTTLKDRVDKLKKIITDNIASFNKINTLQSTTNISDLSLIYDKQVRLPADYDSDEHKNNANTKNDEYIYTADISYDNPNLFYEKYWNVKEFGCSEIIPSFLKDYSYYTPRFGNFIMAPNLLYIWGIITGFIFAMIFIAILFKKMGIDDAADDISHIMSAETLQFLYENLIPLVTLCILIIYIVFFISFNTSFNKYVVYKCLDSSYKRSLNKLNNIITPYIRLHDNKIKKGNKNYLHHYIIANVFYSLLNGDIKLTTASADNTIVNHNDGYELIKTARRDLKTQIIDANLNQIFGPNSDQNPTASVRNAFFNNILSLCTVIKNKVDNAMSKYNDDPNSNTYKNLVTIKNTISLITGAPAVPAVAAVAAVPAVAGVVPSIISRVDETTSTKAALVALIVSIKTHANTAYSLLITTEGNAKNILDVENKSNAIPPKSSDDPDYSTTFDIKSKNYKFAKMNNNILSNDNVFQEYYKEKFKDIYKPYVINTPKVDPDIYVKHLPKIVRSDVKANITTNELLKTYLDANIIKDSTSIDSNLEYIYNIIQRCYELFDENQFNNNLLYYNNPKSKKDGIDIDVYNKFSFYNKNKGDKIIPYQFKLKLDSEYHVKQFIKGAKNSLVMSDIPGLDDLLIFNDVENMSSIDNTKNNKNLEKIIAKFLLIICHINYNKFKYMSATATSAPTQQEIYEKKTRYLYKLFSNTSYNDTYKIDDTFDFAEKDKKSITKEYKELTYIYNYLETKYVYVSSNNNNNYLMNIIKSINNKINEDDKDFNYGSKDAQYLFGNYINKSKEFDNEDEILNIANNISTTRFGLTYISNMILLLSYYYLVLKK